MKKKKLTRHLFFILGVLLFFATMQCYTTFKHPKIYSDTDSTGVYHSEEVSFMDDCSACNEQNDPLIDSHLQVYDYPVYEQNYSWQYYYAIPWWVDEYYYAEDVPQTEPNASLPAPQRRGFDRRKIPPSSATSSSGVSGGSLSKPSSENSTAPAATQQTPNKRNERRQVKTKDSNSKNSTQTGPNRVKKEEKKTKKEKK